MRKMKNGYALKKKVECLCLGGMLIIIIIIITIIIISCIACFVLLRCDYALLDWCCPTFGRRFCLHPDE